MIHHHPDDALLLAYQEDDAAPFGEEGIADAIAAAEAMRAVKSTILPSPELLEEDGA